MHVWQRVSVDALRRAALGQENSVPGATARVYQSALTGQQRSNKSEAGVWNLDRHLRDLVLVDVDSGKVRMIDHGHRIATYALSPDGSHVAVTVPKRFEKAGSQQILFDLNIFSLGVA